MKRIRHLATLAAALLLLTSSAWAQQDVGQPEAQPAEPEITLIGERELEGTVQQVEDAPIEGTDLVFKVALVETDEGMVLTDLGPADDLEGVDVTEGTPISVRGTLVEVEGRPFFVAEQLEVDAREIQIQRPPPPGQAPPGQQPGQEPPGQAPPGQQPGQEPPGQAPPGQQSGQEPSQQPGQQPPSR